MRSKRQCKTGAIRLRTTATRTIKRHALNRTVNRQSSGAILAELKHRLSEIYDLTAAGSVLTWDEATYMPKGGTVARGRQSSLLRRLAHERFVDPALGRLIDRLEPGTDKLQTHGGFGFAEEYDVERKFRETRLYKVTPISTNLIVCFLAERALGLPKPYA